MSHDPKLYRRAIRAVGCDPEAMIANSIGGITQSVPRYSVDEKGNVIDHLTKQVIQPPPITHDEFERKLAEKIVQEVPRYDGWDSDDTAKLENEIAMALATNRARQEKRITQLEELLAKYGWQSNPDRMGQ